MLQVEELLRVSDSLTTWEFLPVNECFFVVCQIQLLEERVCKDTDLGIRLVQVVFAELVQLGEVNERNCLIADAQVSDQFAQIAVGCLVKVRENTIFHLCVHKFLLKRCFFFNNLRPVEVGVLQQISYFVYVDLHALFVGEIHGHFVVSEDILELEVGFFRDFGRLFLKMLLVDEDIVVDVLLVFLSQACLGATVLDEVDQGSLLIFRQAGEDRHALAKVLLVLLQLLVICVCREVHESDILLERVILYIDSF